MEFIFKFQEQEVKMLVEVLGELPTKSGAFPLLTNIISQANNQPQPPKESGNAEESPSNGNV